MDIDIAWEDWVGRQRGEAEDIRECTGVRIWRVLDTRMQS